ncbi:DUF4817 domain-containing protein [Trichonephila clavipes]|nr:DUF4817 domain-containing protein [Trichonephila clavipes]
MYTNEEYCEMVLLYGQYNRNKRQSARLYAIKFPSRRHPSYCTIASAVQRLYKTGSCHKQDEVSLWDLSRMWYQHDGAPAHKSAQPCTFWAQTFDTLIIGYEGQENDKSGKAAQSGRKDRRCASKSHGYEENLSECGTCAPTPVQSVENTKTRPICPQQTPFRSLPELTNTLHMVLQWSSHRSRIPCSSYTGLKPGTSLVAI